MYHRDSKHEGDQDETNVKQDKPMLDDKDLPNDHSNMQIENNALEDKRQVASTDNGNSEKSIASEEQAIINHEECRLENCNDPSNSKLPNDQAPTTQHDSDGSTSKAEIPPSSEEIQEGTLIKEPCHSVEETKETRVSDSCPSDKNDLQQSVKSNISGDHPQPVETTKSTEMVSDSMPSDKSRPQKLPTGSVCESLQMKDSAMDVDMVSNSLPLQKSESQPLSASMSTQHNGTENDVDMMSPSHPAGSNSGAENGTNTGLSLSTLLLSDI